MLGASWDSPVKNTGIDFSDFGPLPGSEAVSNQKRGGCKRKLPKQKSQPLPRTPLPQRRDDLSKVNPLRPPDGACSAKASTEVEFLGLVIEGEEETKVQRHMALSTLGRGFEGNCQTSFESNKKSVAEIFEKGTVRECANAIITSSEQDPLFGRDWPLRMIQIKLKGLDFLEAFLIEILWQKQGQTAQEGEQGFQTGAYERKLEKVFALFTKWHCEAVLFNAFIEGRCDGRLDELLLTHICPELALQFILEASEKEIPVDIGLLSRVLSGELRDENWSNIFLRRVFWHQEVLKLPVPQDLKPILFPKAFGHFLWARYGLFHREYLAISPILSKADIWIVTNNSAKRRFEEAAKCFNENKEAMALLASGETLSPDFFDLHLIHFWDRLCLEGQKDTHSRLDWIASLLILGPEGEKRGDRLFKFLLIMEGEQNLLDGLKCFRRNLPVQKALLSIDLWIARAGGAFAAWYFEDWHRSSQPLEPEDEIIDTVGKELVNEIIDTVGNTDSADRPSAKQWAREMMENLPERSRFPLYCALVAFEAARHQNLETLFRDTTNPITPHLLRECISANLTATMETLTQKFEEKKTYRHLTYLHGEEYAKAAMNLQTALTAFFSIDFSSDAKTYLMILRDRLEAVRGEPANAFVAGWVFNAFFGPHFIEVLHAIHSDRGYLKFSALLASIFVGQRYGFRPGDETRDSKIDYSGKTPERAPLNPLFEKYEYQVLPFLGLVDSDPVLQKATRKSSKSKLSLKRGNSGGKL